MELVADGRYAMDFLSAPELPGQGELTASELHAVPGVAGEADDRRFQRLAMGLEPRHHGGRFHDSSLRVTSRARVGHQYRVAR